MIGKSPNPGILFRNFSNSIIEQPGNGKALSVCQFNFGFRSSRAQCGDQEPSDA